MNVVMMDTAQLNKLAQSFHGVEEEKRANARKFLSCVKGGKIIPVLNYHHVKEMLAHENIEEVSNRISFLREIEVVATIPSLSFHWMPGSVLDLLSFEASFQCQNPGSTFDDVVSGLKSIIFRKVSPIKIFEGIDKNLSMWQQKFIREAEKDRENVAVIVSDFTRHDDPLVSEFLTYKTQPKEVIFKALANHRDVLLSDIKNFGDKRIKSPEQLATNIIDGLMSAAQGNIPSAFDFAVAYLEAVGFSLLDYPKAMRISELIDLNMFHDQLRDAASNARASYNYFKSSVRPEATPSWRVQKGQRDHLQRLPEHKGSELTDRHFTAFIPYCDVGFVDGRTYQNLMRATQKNVIPKDVLSKFVQTSSIEKDLEKLGV